MKHRLTHISDSFHILYVRKRFFGIPYWYKIRDIAKNRLDAIRMCDRLTDLEIKDKRIVATNPLFNPHI